MKKYLFITVLISVILAVTSGTWALTTDVTPPLQIGGGTNANETIGINQQYNLSFNATGGTGSYSWSCSGNPAGMFISGTGSSANFTGSCSTEFSGNITITVTDGRQSASKPFYLTVTSGGGSSAGSTGGTLSMSGMLNDSEAYVGNVQPATYNGLPLGRIVAEGGTPPYTWSLSAATGELPEGLELACYGNEGTVGTADGLKGKYAILKGIPTKAGKYYLSIIVRDAIGQFESYPLKYTFEVKENKIADASETAPKISTKSLANGTVGTNYSVKLASDKSGAVWSLVSGTLPYGLKLNYKTGEITGAPEENGSYTFSVKAVYKGLVSEAQKLMINIEKIETPKPEFRAHSLLLSGQIGVNFYMTLPEIPGVDYTNSYMEFDISGDRSNAPQYFDANFMDKSKTYYGFRCYIKSIQMADKITAVFHYQNGDAILAPFESLKHEYTAKKYLDASLADTNISDEELALIEAIKDYGHYAQLYLSRLHNFTLGKDYSVMDKVNSFWGSALSRALKMSELSDNLKGYAIVRDPGTDSGITKVSFSLNLDADTTINLYIYPTDDYINSGGKVTAVQEGLSGGNVANYQPTNKRYKVEIKNIPAHELSKTFTVKVKAKKEFDVKVSVFSYIYDVCSDNSAQEDEEAAVYALYRYYITNMDYRAAIGLN